MSAIKFEIKSRFSGAVLFSLECGSLRLCVEAAVKSCANLSGADLSGADLSDADLSDADLSRANLSCADLSCADLSCADLSCADLSRANLSGADLSRADLSCANLSGADLSGAKNAELQIARQRITPQEGAFVGWKKLCDGVIAQLVIPHDAKRLNAIGSRKCRAERVHVHAMWNRKGEPYTGVGIGMHDNKTQYVVGKETLPNSFTDDVREECSYGIHFFITREEAEDYYMSIADQTTPTREVFLAQLRRELQRYSWAQNKGDLNAFMVSAAFTLEGKGTTVEIGEAFKDAAKAVGMKGRLTLKALRALPQGAA